MGFVTVKPKEYLSINSAGKIVQRFAKPNALTTERKIKDSDKIVYEVYHPAFDGYIINAFKKTNEWQGKKIVSLVLVLEDAGTEYELSLSYSGSQSNGFWMVMPNIDFTKQVRISPWYNPEKDRVQLYLNKPYESDREKAKIQWAWTKEEPGDLPQPEEVEFNGEVKLNWNAQIKFLENMLENVIIPRMKAAKEDRDKNGAATIEVTGSVEPEPEDVQEYHEEEPTAEELAAEKAKENIFAKKNAEAGAKTVQTESLSAEAEKKSGKSLPF